MAEVSHKSEMGSPFNRDDTIINKHFTTASDTQSKIYFRTYIRV